MKQEEWSLQEKQELLEAIRVHGKDLNKLQQMFPQRSRRKIAQTMRHLVGKYDDLKLEKNSENTTSRPDRWTNEEYERLFNGILKWGKSPGQLVEMVGNRTKSAISDKIKKL